MKTIFNYTNYRLFVKDRYDILKIENPKLTYREFNVSAGFKSPSFLLSLIQGKRNLTKSGAVKLSKALMLNEIESDYFVNLCLFNQSKNLEEQLEYSKKMLISKKTQKRLLISSEMVSFYQTWLTAAVREVILKNNNQCSFVAIKEEFEDAVTASEIRESLYILETLGLIRKLSNGNFESTKEVLLTPKEAGNIVIPFHISMIQKALESISSVSPSQREISSVTLRISTKKIDSYKKAVYSFYEEVLNISAAEDEANSVYQLNLQFFPLTKLKE